MLKQVKSLYDNSAPIDLKDSQRQYLVCAIGDRRPQTTQTSCKGIILNEGGNFRAKEVNGNYCLWSCPNK